MAEFKTYSKEKEDELLAEKLSLSGGTMTGNIVFGYAGGVITQGSNGNTISRMQGGTSYHRGAALTLYNKDYEDNEGHFILNADNSANEGGTYCYLRGTPDGLLTWGINGLHGKAITGATRDSLLELTPSGGCRIFPKVQFTAAESPSGVTSTAYVVIVFRNTNNYAAIKCLHNNQPLENISNRQGSTTWSDWKRNVYTSSTTFTWGNMNLYSSTLTNQTVAGLFDLATNGQTIIFPQVKFTAAESPNGSASTAWVITLFRATDNYGFINANCIGTEYQNNFSNGTWSGWTTRYLPLTGGTLSGDLLFSGGDRIIRPSANGKLFLKMYGGVALKDGASVACYNKDYTDYEGQFIISADNRNNTGGTNCSMRGYPDGTLTWGGKNVVTDTGTAGQILISNASGAAPLWADVCTQIGSTTLKSADDTATMSEDYTNFQMILFTGYSPNDSTSRYTTIMYPTSYVSLDAQLEFGKNTKDENRNIVVSFTSSTVLKCIEATNFRLTRVYGIMRKQSA